MTSPTWLSRLVEAAALLGAALLRRPSVEFVVPKTKNSTLAESAAEPVARAPAHGPRAARSP